MMDRVDETILYYLEHGQTNAYQVWKAMNIDANGNGLAYVNIYKRTRSLWDDGMIERTQPTGENLHGGRYYRITKKGKQTIQEHINKLEQILK